MSGFQLPDVDTHVQAQAVVDVVRERARQDEKWGDQSGHSLHVWLGILAEEFGEVAKEVMAWAGADPETSRDYFKSGLTALREELVQVAAVAVAWAEALS